MTPSASASARRGSLAARFFRVTGTFACLLALAMTVGGHWMALQSVAWGKMIVDFSRHDSLTEALRKTFDGQHPCSLCRQVQLGQQNEREEQRRQPLLGVKHMLEFLPSAGAVLAPQPPSTGSPHTSYAPDRHPQYVHAPPKPPPRRSLTSLISSRIVVAFGEPLSHRGWPIDRQCGVWNHPTRRTVESRSRLTSSPDTGFRTPPIGRWPHVLHSSRRSMPNILMKVSEKAMRAIQRPETDSACAPNGSTTHPHVDPTQANPTIQWN
jgi:hypothetical protein